MKTQITKLEMEVLNAIQEFTAEGFTSDTGNWAYVKDIEFDSRQLRALLTTLNTKGILIYDSTYDGNYVEIQENFYKETGNYTRVGSPEIEFINLEVKQ